MVIVGNELIQSSSRFLAIISEGLTDYLLNMFGNILKAFLNTAGFESETNMESFQEFSAARCQKWFESLCLEMEGTMTPNDILALCESINKSPSDIVFLLLAYKMGAKTCGLFHQDEWMQGMTDLQIDTSLKLIQSWDRLRLLLDDPDLEKEVYRFSYDFSRDRERSGNNIDVMSGSELIKLFLENKWKHCHSFLRFLSYADVKYITRDQFLNVLEFSRCITTLDDYDDTAAWPVLMDEFVAYVVQQKDLDTSEEGRNSSGIGGKRTFSSAECDSSEINSKRKL